jgi:26S proteasome regulatory subunit N7
MELLELPLFGMPEETAEIIQRQGLPLRIAEYRFLLLSGMLSSSEQSDTVSKLVDAAIALDNAPAYTEAMASFGYMGEESVVEGMRTRNAAKLAKIEADIMDAKENLGEEEVRQGMFAKATVLAESGDTKAAIAVFNEIEAQKKTTTGQKVDIAFSKLRIAFAGDDLPLMSKTIEKAKEYVEVGGDWERRNRLKVYEAVFFTRTRHFSKAANMFLESIATFTAVELFDYPRQNPQVKNKFKTLNPYRFIKYAVATSVVALERSTLKAKVIDSPEVIAVIHEVASVCCSIETLLVVAFDPLQFS